MHHKGHCVILSAVVGLAFSMLACKTTQPAKGDWLMLLGEQKSVAESEAQAFKRAIAKDQPGYAQTAVRYEEAKAKVDGWIQGLQSAIQGTTSLTEAQYKSKLEEAVAASRAFVESSRKERGMGKGVPLADIGALIIQVGNAIWEAKAKLDDQRRKAILADLEKYRWDPFEET